MIDTHAHFNSKDLKDGLNREIELINESDLTFIVNVALDLETSKEVIDIARANPKFYCSIGIHPLHDGQIEDVKTLYEKSDNSKIVAIGETGLDKRISSHIDLKSQTKKFIETIEFANYFKLPVIIHSNGAHPEVISIIKRYRPEYGFVMHCFEPDLEVLKEIISQGGFISVATPITYPTANKSLQVIAQVPIEHLLIELDYPYMSKNPFIDGRNVFNKIREIRNMSKSELEETLDGNARRLFKKLY